MYRILVVDDEAKIRLLIRKYAEFEGHEVTEAENGMEAVRLFRKTPDAFDIVIMDVMMPELDGFALAKGIREIDAHIPIISLTAKNLKQDVIEGFKSGADDYLTKPFSMEELIYRLEAILRRTSARPQDARADVYTIGKFTFDVTKQLLIYQDQPRKLTTKESELLELLCRHRNEVLERNFALKSIWIDDNYFNARSMDVYITKLRKYLSKDESVEILNIHGRGYKLLC